MRSAAEVLRNSSEMLSPVKVGDIALEFNLKNFNDANYTAWAKPEVTLVAMNLIV
jgi:hypothetical protein